MGDGPPTGLGGSTIESAQIPGYGQFSYPAWVVQPLTATRNFATPSYSPPSLYTRVAKSDWRSFAVEIYRVDATREDDT
ncbi:hypothetical protein GW17_00060610 [Ensete ventricosum]|nr:hypothetical protein GW17_00060610 [Ensete ventricosum]